MKEFEIWIGYYHLGQGYTPPREPKKAATIQSVSFLAACFEYELQISLESIKSQKEQGYVDRQSLHWWFDDKMCSNSWTGKYFETKEAALASFP